MDTQILIGLLLTILPLTELRGGLPVIIEYVTRNNLSIWPYFLLVLILNILVIFVIFFFLDHLHNFFMKSRAYSRLIGYYLKRIEKKSEKISRKVGIWEYVGLMLFVAVPLPLTGAWTGCFVAWFLGLDRLKSIIAISLGIIIAGIIILFASLGFFSLF